jgi:hypothetical protein
MPTDLPSPPKSSSPPNDDPRNAPEQPHHPPYPAPSPPGDAWPKPYEGKIIFCSDASSWAPTPPGVSTEPIVTPELFSINGIEIITGDPNEALPYAAYNNFSLPVNVPSKAVFSSGRHASGSITLRARKLEDVDRIAIIIQASYQYESALAATNICLLEQKDGSQKLGIYVSKEIALSSSWS